jgi:hypothetical protein
MSLAGFIEDKSRLMPNWIKVICSVRSDRVDIIKELPFQRLR